MKDMKTNVELAARAAFDSRQEARSADMVPSSLWPRDLARFYYEMQDAARPITGVPFSGAKVLGFVWAPHETHHYFLKGKEVTDQIDWLGTMTTQGRFWLLKRSRADVGTIRVEPNAIDRKTTSYPAWYAVVEGNAITVSRVARQLGFDKAYNNNATYVFLREMEGDEAVDLVVNKGKL